MENYFVFIWLHALIKAIKKINLSLEIKFKVVVK